MSVSKLAAAGRYGKLWGRGHETFPKSLRRILSIKGKESNATNYLNGLVTCDLKQEPKVHMQPRMEYDPEEIDESQLMNQQQQQQGGPRPPGGLAVDFTSHMRSTCFLDQKGRIVTDALLWKFPFVEDVNDDKLEQNEDIEYLIDVPSDSADELLSHLQKYKLRRTKVEIQDVTEQYSVHATYGTLNAKGTPPGFVASVDPRHPSLGIRILSFDQDTTAEKTKKGRKSATNTPISTPQERATEFSKMMTNVFAPCNGTYNVLRKLAGIAEGSEIKGKTPLECNQEFLNAIAFDKGCYLGQELTARSQFKGTIRKRIMPIIIMDTMMEVPRPWVLAAKIQEMGIENLQTDMMKGLGIGLESNGSGGKSHVPPLLPRISAPGVGGIIAMMQGNLNLPKIPMPPPSNPQDGGDGDGDGDNNITTSAAGDTPTMQKVELTDEEKQYMEKLKIENIALMSDLEQIAIPGAKIVNQKDGKTIGEIISSPASGTPLVLALMRLDEVGLLQSSSKGSSSGDEKGAAAAAAENKNKWSLTNKILIGDGQREYRYLPFLPLFWPEIDNKSGKKKME